MIVKVFSVYDSASRIYMQPFSCPTVATALRAFRDCANSPQHFIGQHPADYTLMEIATFCDSTGAYMPLSQYVNHGNAIEHKTRKEELQVDAFIQNEEETRVQ